MHWPDLLIGGAIGAAVTLVGGYVFYVLQARRAAPSLAFQSSSWPVVTRSDQQVRGLGVTFRGADVPRLTRTRIAMWNPRWAVIHGADIAESDPLRIGFRDAEVLDVRLATQTRDAISFTSEVRDGACYVEFDFLDRHDGVMLELLHTADDNARPSIQGTVKGLPAGVSYFGDLIPTPRERRPEQAMRVTTVLALVCFITGAVLIAGAGITSGKPDSGMYGAGGILIAIGLMVASIIWSRRLPRPLARARKPGSAAETHRLQRFSRSRP